MQHCCRRSLWQVPDITLTIWSCARTRTKRARPVPCCRRCTSRLHPTTNALAEVPVPQHLRPWRARCARRFLPRLLCSIDYLELDTIDQMRRIAQAPSGKRLRYQDLVGVSSAANSSGPHHQDSGEAKIRESMGCRSGRCQISPLRSGVALGLERKELGRCPAVGGVRAGCIPPRTRWLKCLCHNICVLGARDARDGSCPVFCAQLTIWNLTPSTR